MSLPPRRPQPRGATTASRSPSSIGALLEQARDVSARAGGVVIDRERWRRAVGDRIAARTEPGRLRGGVLTLHVASAAWAQELSFFSTDLLERVRALGVPAQSLRFQVRALSAPGAAVPPAREAAARAALPKDVEERLKNVDDPALRAAIAEAAALALASSAPRARGRKSAAERSDPRDRMPSGAPRGSRRKP